MQVTAAVKREFSSQSSHSQTGGLRCPQLRLSDRGARRGSRAGANCSFRSPFHTRLEGSELDAPLCGKSNLPSVASERAPLRSSGQTLVPTCSWPQRHEKCPLQPLLWGAPKGLNTALPGSHKQPQCQSESIHSPLHTAYATESGTAIVLDRRGREGKRRLAGRKMRGKRTEQGSMGGQFLNLPDFHYQKF